MRTATVSPSETSAATPAPATSPRSISFPRRNGRGSATSKAAFSAVRIAAIIPLAENTTPSRPSRPRVDSPPVALRRVERRLSSPPGDRGRFWAMASTTSAWMPVARTTIPNAAARTMASGNSEKSTW